MNGLGSLHTIQLAAGRRIELLRGDITAQDVCAIVNAANAALAPGGGVCGAIHHAAGNEPFDEAARIVRQRGRLSPGEAVATSGGRLKARYIVHAVGPVWHGGHSGEREALASAYRLSVRVADNLDCDTLAFPSISTGIYGFPVTIAAPIALQALREALAEAEHVAEIRVLLFDGATARAWVEAARTLGW
jgi:O-acetyl-ADP-ribose deacetylase (regulator of RNase III)